MSRNPWPAAVALLAALGGCAQVDAAMRRVDVLDRVFEPERFRPRGADPVVPAALPSQPPDLPKAPVAEPPPAPEPDLPASIPFGPSPSVPAPAAPMPAAVPAPSTEVALRRNPWLARFWSELSPAQRQRIAPALPEGDEPAAWDRMGLPDRARLLHGG